MLVFFDGAVAKDLAFLMPMSQPDLPGIEMSIGAYIELKQVPWLNLTEEVGALPTARTMHAGMFTDDAQVPFGVHVSAANPAGFGAQRVLKEVCGIDREAEPEKYTKAMRSIKRALGAFDRQVLEQLQATHPEIENVQQMRWAMHKDMMTALQEFGVRKGIIHEGESLKDFQALFAQAAEKGVALNAYQYMREYKQVLFEVSPLAKDITDIATVEKERQHADGKSYMQLQAEALGKMGARAVMYDAVAVEASRVVRSHPALQAHFSEREGLINITPEAVDRLRNAEPDLYQTFEREIVAGLTRDGGKTVGTMQAASQRADLSRFAPSRNVLLARGERRSGSTSPDDGQRGWNR